MKTITVFTPDEKIKISAVCPLDENSSPELEESYRQMLLGTAHTLAGAIKSEENRKNFILGFISLNKYLSGNF